MINFSNNAKRFGLGYIQEHPIFKYFLANASYGSGFSSSTNSTKGFNPEQFSNATITPPFSSIARATLRAAPLDGEPVTKIRGFLPTFLPALYSASILSAIA